MHLYQLRIFRTVCTYTSCPAMFPHTRSLGSMAQWLNLEGHISSWKHENKVNETKRNETTAYISFFSRAIYTYRGNCHWLCWILRSKSQNASQWSLLRWENVIFTNFMLAFKQLVNCFAITKCHDMIFRLYRSSVEHNDGSVEHNRSVHIWTCNVWTCSHR